MGSADDYKKDLDRLLGLTQRKADYASELRSKEALASWQKRGRDVGIRFGEFYDRFMKEPQKLLADIVVLEKKRIKPSQSA